MTRIVCVLSMVCLLSTPAWADEGLYVTGAIGQSRFSLTTPDGTWRQEGLGYHATKEALAWAAGVGYGWEHLAVELTYVDFGHVSSGGLAVGDWAYHPETQTYNHKAKVVKFDATDQMQGGSVRVKYNWDVWGFRPFLAGGFWVGHHALTFWTDHGKGHITNNDSFRGILAGPVVGGGICYKWVCGQVDYYRAVTQSGFPISTEIVMPSALVKVPLSW